MYSLEYSIVFHKSFKISVKKIFRASENSYCGREKRVKNVKKYREIVGKEYKIKEACEINNRLSREVNLLN